MPHRLFRLLALIWAGSQWTIGYLAAPVLFSMLSRIDAGHVAGRLFYCEAILGCICGILLLTLGNQMVRRGDVGYRRLRWPVLAMLICTLLGYFALEPLMSGLRSSAEAHGTDVGHSVYAARFGLLHAVSTVFYGLQSVFALILVWRLPMVARHL
jgi:hypothetical protein